MLATGLNDQHPAAANGVFALVVLQFVVADETALVAPVGLVGRAVLVELVVPDHFPLGGIGGGLHCRQTGRDADENSYKPPS